MKRPCVLITSIGSRAAEGVLASLQPLRAQLRLVATNSIAGAPGLYDADAAYLVPATAQRAAYVQHLAEIVEREQPALIFNGRDEEVPALAELAERHPAAGWLLPPAALAPVFNDKLQTARFAARHGLPFADTAVEPDAVQALLARHGLPLVAKPCVGGYNSRDVFVVTRAHQLAALLARGGHAFQPFLGGPALARRFVEFDDAAGLPWTWHPRNTYQTLEVLIGRHGELLQAFATEAVRIGSTVNEVRLRQEPALQALAERHAQVLAAAGHRGPLNVQGFCDEAGAFQAFEWNARIVGTAPGYALLGRNLVLTALLHVLPELAAHVPVQGPALAVFRPLAFRGVPQAWIDQLQRDGVWHAP